ncbi:Hypothetical protein A7982_03308 [Minicystis rosea]|nr:Hypothetical protein A7982_03308 [Minicystis rosea]
MFLYAAQKGSDDVVAKLQPFCGTLTARARDARWARAPPR